MTKVAPRQRLVDTARVVAERDGLQGLTLRAIAREAGVSHGAPLRHFPTLASLLAALGVWGFERLIEAVAAEVAGTPVDDPRGRVTAAGRGYLAFADAHPGVYTVMFRPDLVDTADPDYVAAAAASFAQLTELVAAAQADGWLPDSTRDRVADVLWAQVHGLADLRIHGALGPDGIDEIIALATELR